MGCFVALTLRVRMAGERSRAELETAFLTRSVRATKGNA